MTLILHRVMASTCTQGLSVTQLMGTFIFVFVVVASCKVDQKTHMLTHIHKV